jgi:hypothetical protein
MNHISLCILFFFCFANFSTTQELWLPTLEKTTSKYTNKILKSTDLQQVYKDIPNDKLLQLERLTSYLFLKLLNQYRAENGLSQLKWDENLWLAARNHNIYMAYVEYSHYQEYKKSVYYTGLNSYNRSDFVYGKTCTYATSENIQYFQMYLRFYAVSIAQESLEIWKNSPPHNKNMLNSDHYSTGVSLYLDIPNKMIYGTNIFSQDTSIETQQIEISWNAELSKIYKNYKGEKNSKYWGNELKLGKQ